MNDKQQAREMARRILAEYSENRSSGTIQSAHLGPQYVVENNLLNHVITGRNGEIQKRPIANFAPMPIREILRDDGDETVLTFELGARTSTGDILPIIQVPASQFHSMAWVEKEWGLRANIEPGTSNRDRVRHFIQGQAAGIPRQTIYAHTGWRKVNGVWIYLHGKGAIGASDIDVDLAENGLNLYSLPGVSEPLLREDLDKSMQFLDLAPPSVTVPALALCYLAPLLDPLKRAAIEPSFLVWLIGPTGAGKSSLAAVLLSHFGDFNNKSLPASFKDTANFLERRAFVLKDSLLIVDDYHPTYSGNDARKMQSTAQALCRLFGDRTARGRLTSDIRVRNSKPARCLALVTGEDTPDLGESGLARILSIELGRGDIDFDILSALQDNTISLRRNMSAYVQWLAPRMDDLPELLKQEFLKRREMASKGGHRRMPEIAAWLYLGWKMAMEFHHDMGILDAEQMQDRLDQGWNTILELCMRQGQKVTEEKPSAFFISLLKEMVAAGEVEIEKLTPFEGDGVTFYSDNAMSRTTMIGWQDDNWLYLMPGQTFKVIQKFCRDQGSHFPVSENTLWKHLAEDGFIQIEDSGKERRLKVQKTIGGRKLRVIKLPAALIFR